MAEEQRSKLFALRPIIERWPAVARPEIHVHFRTKLLWTITCLILYYILTQVQIYGLRPHVVDMFSEWRAIPVSYTHLTLPTNREV